MARMDDSCASEHLQLWDGVHPQTQAQACKAGLSKSPHIYMETKDDLEKCSGCTLEAISQPPACSTFVKMLHFTQNKLVFQVASLPKQDLERLSSCARMACLSHNQDA